MDNPKTTVIGYVTLVLGILVAVGAGAACLLGFMHTGQLSDLTACIAGIGAGGVGVTAGVGHIMGKDGGH